MQPRVVSILNISFWVNNLKCVISNECTYITLLNIEATPKQTIPSAIKTHIINEYKQKHLFVQYFFKNSYYRSTDDHASWKSTQFSFFMQLARDSLKEHKRCVSMRKYNFERDFSRIGKNIFFALFSCGRSFEGGKQNRKFFFNRRNFSHIYRRIFSTSF